MQVKETKEGKAKPRMTIQKFEYVDEYNSELTAE